MLCSSRKNNKTWRSAIKRENLCSSSFPTRILFPGREFFLPLPPFPSPKRFAESIIIIKKKKKKDNPGSEDFCSRFFFFRFPVRRCTGKKREGKGKKGKGHSHDAMEGCQNFRDSLSIRSLILCISPGSTGTSPARICIMRRPSSLRILSCSG